MTSICPNRRYIERRCLKCALWMIRSGVKYSRLHFILDLLWISGELLLVSHFAIFFLETGRKVSSKQTGVNGVWVPYPGCLGICTSPPREWSYAPLQTIGPKLLAQDTPQKCLPLGHWMSLQSHCCYWTCKNTQVPLSSTHSLDSHFTNKPITPRVTPQHPVTSLRHKRKSDRRMRMAAFIVCRGWMHFIYQWLHWCNSGIASFFFFFYQDTIPNNC